MRRASAAVLLLLLLAAPAAASPEDVANSISMQVMSPFCDGVTLHDCASRQSEELREQIHAWARQGVTRAEIMDRLERTYGERIHATPRPEGIGLVAWVLPALAVAAGLVAVALLVRRWTREREVAGAASAPIGPEDRERLDRELRAMEAEA